MPRSRASAEHHEAVSRRLARLSAELSAGAGATDPDPSIPVTTIPVAGRHAARRRRPRAGQDWAARFALEPRHWVLVGLALALGLAGTAWWLVRSRPSDPVPAPLPASALTTPSGSPGSPGSSGSPGLAASPSGQVVVDVAGRVRRPGIAVLSSGARVVDALKAAGGVRPGVDLASLNLARVLVDGEQLLVGVRQPGLPGAVAGSGTVPSASAPAALVNLNTADEATLEGLPEVGPVTAQAIIAWRTEHGGFTSVDQLMDVDGIGEVTLRQIAPLVTI